MNIVANYQCETGEGPTWHPLENVLYWVDIPRGLMFRYDPETGKHTNVFKGPELGGITVQKDGSILMFMEKGQVGIWQNGEFEVLIDHIDGEEDSRFNDVIAAPNGSVFCGTMPTERHEATLYRIDKDLSIHRIVENVGISNGLGFTKDLSRMYYTDSTARTIYKFDFDPESSQVANRKIFLQTDDDGTIPDGMTVDSEDCVWSARWDGYSLYRYTPDGEEIEKVNFDTKKISCPTFGGPDFSDLYVTSAGGHNLAENGPTAGALFRLRTGVIGKQEYFSDIAL